MSGDVLPIREVLLRVADDPALLEVGRRAVEEALIEFRDSRISELGRGNGLVVREKDGKASSVIRFGPESAVRIALRAIAESSPTPDVNP